MTTTDLEEALVTQYRRLPIVERRRVARRATPDLRRRLAGVEREMAMDRSPGSLAAVLTRGKEIQAPHLDLIDHAFQRIAAGERVKVMLTMPPRHGKSRRASRWAPVWYLRRHPDHRLMLASYSATLADDHGRWIRDTITGYAATLGIALNPSSHAANRFDIQGHEGGMVTAGVGGGLTGKGANCFPDETLVTTQIGRISIADLVAMKEKPLVLSFNHATGRPEWRRVLATRTTYANGLYEVISTRGHRIRATAHHPVYVPGSGYRQAATLRPGDRLSSHGVADQPDLHPVRQGQGSGRSWPLLPGLLRASALSEDPPALPMVRRRVSETALRVQQGNPAQSLFLLLLQTALAGAPRHQEREAVRAMRRADAWKKRQQVLLQAMPDRRPAAPGESLHHVRPVLPAPQQPHHVLLTALRGQRALAPHARRGELALQGRHQLQQVVPGDPAPDLRAGQRLLRGLLGALQASHLHPQRPTRPAVEPHRAPPRRGPRQQPGGEPAAPLLLLSPRAPQVHPDAVSVVRPVHASRVRVHDLQVEGNSNFFAGGLLVHNCLIVDDPFKGSEDAESQTQRDRVWDWWQSVALTRLEPNGSLVVINTRWNPDDLSGRLLATEKDEWTVLDLPAIAMHEDDPLGRPTGKALWPDRYATKDLERIRKGVGERVWWSLYQQQPRPLEGGVWQWSWITQNRVDPMAFRGVDLIRTAVCLDPAGGGSASNDESGIVGGGVTADGHCYLLADRSGKLTADERGRATCLLAIELKADAIVVETNYGGDMAKQNVIQAWQQLERESATSGMLMPRIIGVNAKQGKRLRAEPVAQVYELGRVHHVGELPTLETQMVTWLPGMDSPDRMDAAVHLITELVDPEAVDTTGGSYQDNRLGGRR